MPKDIRWGFFGSLFDRNRDGKLDLWEEAEDEAEYLARRGEKVADDRLREAELRALTTQGGGLTAPDAFDRLLQGDDGTVPTQSSGGWDSFGPDDPL